LKNQVPSNLHINDPELKEWLDALKNIIDEQGADRASLI